MTTASIDEHVKRSLAALKDFQRATVDVVYDNLFKNGQQRMLVADEVGLGKTIVAKGIIARRIVEKFETGDATPLKVTYICSNQVIAHENVGKLDIYPDQRSHDRFASRLTYLAFQPDSGGQGPLRLNTLTPATSFNKGNSTGQQGERRIIYSLLMQADVFRNHGKALSAMLRANVQKPASAWYELLDAERDRPYGLPLRPCCHSRFLEAIRTKEIKYQDCPLFSALGITRSISLYDAIAAFTSLLNLKNLGQYRDGSDHLVRELKDSLSEVCVEYIDADFYILDEFQRFKELVNQDGESEAAEIARRIFSKKQARILLLSATPFKAYTGNSPWESGEEHYKEFRAILNFLFDGDKEVLREYEVQRQALFKQLLELGANHIDINTSHRDLVQQLLRRVICRTERLSVSQDFNAMTIDKWQSQPLQLTAGDIENFIATDNIVRSLNDAAPDSRNPIHAPIEFCKSAPFPLSFLDDYKLKQKLQEKKQDNLVRKSLKANTTAWIDHSRVHRYESFLEDASQSVTHSKLLLILREVLGQNGQNLLWIPPSLPSYPLEGAYRHTNGFSKTLIFSAWLMVPRMLASLISYEVERLTVGNPESVESQEKGTESEGRKYFHSKKERRHPIPQLVFSQKKTESGDLSGNMSNFALLYPSVTLTKLFNPNEAIGSQGSLSEIRGEVKSRVERLIARTELHRFGSSTGESDKWYWAAPLLIDRYDNELRPTINSWLHSEWWKDSRFHISQDNSETTSKDKHFDEFTNCFMNPHLMGLGPFPQNLSEVLTDIAIASPANALFRASAPYATTVVERIAFAFEIAAEFLSMFNKPESIAAVRLTTRRAPYYQRVLEYCANGCLESVLEEWIHVAKPTGSTIRELYTTLVESMNLGTSSIKVDDLNSFLHNSRRNMRCHYAVDLGNQRVETDEGQHRVKGIRNNFNSPFRPFVLATTSIGQEGLDFHTYCRKIVHWNLPSNPIDLEQREGRINRFKGLVIRQQIASKYRHLLTNESIQALGAWDALFDIAAKQEKIGNKTCDLIPFWHVEADQYQIERIIPFYPFSRDRMRLSLLLKTLAIYRLAFGQPRQAELVEHLLTNVSEDQIAKIRGSLMIDLSPISYANASGLPST